MVRKVILYFAFVLLFVIEKPLFMLYHWDIYSEFQFIDWMAVIWNGLPHDLTVAGYFSAVPFLLSLVYVWVPGRWHLTIMHCYLRIILLFALLIFFVDLELYTHWGFRLDATPLIYLTDKPGEAIANAPTWSLVVFPIFLIATWFFLQRAYYRIFTCQRLSACDSCKKNTLSVKTKMLRSLGVLLMCGLLFIPIRGGFTVSTMNVGRVYFSADMKLNHAAINPIFSFLSSISKSDDFGKQYRFMSDAEATDAISELNSMPLQVSPGTGQTSESTNCLNHASSAKSMADSVGMNVDSLPSWQLLKNQRPNVVLVILESFSGGACVPLYPDANPAIMPNINRFYEEGIGFMQMYANSFRTDRGLAAVLSAYPGQPTNSIMKQPLKSQNLQYISRRMLEYGYDLEFVHGGDADFTNLRSFLMAGGIEHITADADFPISQRLSKWGVPDDLVFNYLFDDVVNQSAEQTSAREQGEYNGAGSPFLKVFLTLSSHEPFDVPYHHLDDIYENSVAYTDSCLGSFVDKLKATPYWDNTLVIGIPDHCFAKFPTGVMTHEIIRYHIPMFWMGGAIAQPRRISVRGSQTDLAATLLRQLDMHHEDFNFSKDLMNDSISHYAFYAWPDGFGFLTDSISYIQDNANDAHPLSGSYDPNGKAEHWGKAYLQKLYDDLSKR